MKQTITGLLTVLFLWGVNSASFAETGTQTNSDSVNMQQQYQKNEQSATENPPGNQKTQRAIQKGLSGNTSQPTPGFSDRMNNAATPIGRGSR